MKNDFNDVCRLLAGKPGHVHFVGVCGVGMAGLAFHLKHKGWRVSGCDLQRQTVAAWLESAGIEVRRGHDPAHLSGVDWVVRTTAVRSDHPEIVAASVLNLPVFQRGVVLAALLSGFVSIIVSGTHGKTTTTAMLTQILLAAGRDPSYCIGGESTFGGELTPRPSGKLERVAGTPAVAGVGDGDCLVVEADESDGTLACYASDIAVVTNIEFDHAEHFADLAALRECFANMLRQVRRGIIYCADDPEALLLCHGLVRAVSYGLASTAEWRAAAIKETADEISFQVWRGAEKIGGICLPAPGRHNLLNALAACAAASACGVGFDDMRLGLQDFQPVRRRFERVIAKDDVLVISDYAHHPTEIAATLRNLPGLQRKRWMVVFQPHRFSRTLALADDFAAVLAGVKKLVLTPVYAASESSMAGGTHWDLYAQIRQIGPIRAFTATSLVQVWGYVRATLRPGDGLLIMGAGDVEQIARWARAELAECGLAALNPAHAWAVALENMQWKSAVFKRQVSLAARTTLRVGGSADILAELDDEKDLTKLIRWTHKHQVPVILLGAGSNVLVSDLGVRGVVVRLVGRSFRQIRVVVGAGASVRRPSSVVCRPAFQVIVGAGVSLHELTSFLAEHGLAGLEFLTGIPGTVGGALRMNAGAWGENIGARVAWVRFLNPDGSGQAAESAALGFGYRHCAGLARQCRAVDGKIVLEAAFNMMPSNQQAVRARMNEILKRRAWLCAWPSAGSVFRNPLPSPDRPEGGFAGHLLEQAGMKGRRIGGARVLKEHANMIVTEPGACASDIRALMEIMRQAVRERSGIELTGEIVCLE
ncbi:MAG: UDP-N-acetylmuramate--L-alanine ligase [Verrucomicrobiota bacterium]